MVDLLALLAMLTSTPSDHTGPVRLADLRDPFAVRRAPGTEVSHVRVRYIADLKDPFSRRHRFLGPPPRALRVPSDLRDPFSTTRNPPPPCSAPGRETRAGVPIQRPRGLVQRQQSPRGCTVRLPKTHDLLDPFRRNRS